MFSGGHYPVSFQVKLRVLYPDVLVSGSVGHNHVAMATKWIDLITLIS